MKLFFHEAKAFNIFVFLSLCVLQQLLYYTYNFFLSKTFFPYRYTTCMCLWIHDKLIQTLREQNILLFIYLMWIEIFSTPKCSCLLHLYDILIFLIFIRVQHQHNILGKICTERISIEDYECAVTFKKIIRSFSVRLVPHTEAYTFILLIHTPRMYGR